MTDDELLFFDSMPRMLPIYEAFCQGLADRGLAFTAKVSRTQISLRNRYVFAAVSLPWRKVKGWPEEYLLVSLGLSYHKESPPGGGGHRALPQPLDPPHPAHDPQRGGRRTAGLDRRGLPVRPHQVMLQNRAKAAGKEDPTRYKSQLTLAKRRIEAFTIANELIQRELDTRNQ